MSQPNKLTKRRALEKMAFALGDFSAFGQEELLKAYAARILKNDYKLAAAIELVENFPDIEKIKNNLSLGHLETARNILIRAEAESVDADDRAELKLEAARLANFSGEFELCIQEASSCVDQSFSGPTKMAALQVRANAHFEIGGFEQASSDLAQVTLLAKLYPFSPVVFYADTLGIRLCARRHSVTQARDKLERLFFLRQKTGFLNLDTLLTYLRVRIDLCRLEQTDYYNLAVGSYLVAEAVGDQLYMGLALLDIWSALPREERDLVNPHLERARKAFTKIARFQDEALNNSISKTVTARAISECLNVSNPVQKGLENVEDLFGQEYDCLFIKDKSLWVQLKKQKLHLIAQRPQINLAVEVLKDGSISKEVFFSRVWPENVFHPLNSDTLIRTLLRRIRMETKLAVISREGQLHLEEKILCL